VPFLSAEHIVAVSAEQHVVAATGEQDVETGPAEQDVVADSAEQDVVAAATVGLELHSNRLQAGGLDDIVAAESVHDEPVAGSVGPGDAHLSGQPGYCAHAAGGCRLDRVGLGGAVHDHASVFPPGTAKSNRLISTRSTSVPVRSLITTRSAPPKERNEDNS